MYHLAPRISPQLGFYPFILVVLRLGMHNVLMMEFPCFSECLSRLNHDPLLISAVGADPPGDMIMERLQELEMVGACCIRYVYLHLRKPVNS